MSQSPNESLSFEQSLAELERVVRDLEDGELGLEEALSRYEAGVGLLKRCYNQLQSAEQKIQLLTGVDGEGNPVLQPFHHTATADAPADNRRRRPKSAEPEILF